MTLPTIVTVKAVITDSSGPVAGRISWHRNVSALPASPSDETYLIPEVVETVVGTDGVVAQPLYSCNDPVASPTGFTWTVYPHFPNWRESFDIVVPYDAVDGEVNLSQLAPVPATDGELYALANHTHSGGGGGSGIDPASTVTSELTYGQSASAGNAATYSRGNHTHGTPVLPTAADVGAATSGHAHSGVYDPAGSAAAAASSAASALAAHEADTTAVHGISNSANLVYTDDSRLTNARTPTSHAASHQDGGSDGLALDASQVTTGTLAIGRVPTGTSGTTVALGNAPAGAVSTHVGEANPHTQYRRTYFETAGTYAVVTGARDFIGPDDPATEGFTLADGDKWYEV